MREVHVDQIRATVRQLCQDAATLLPDDVLEALKGARAAEESELGVFVLDQILENADLAARERLPLCQDTGTTPCPPVIVGVGIGGTAEHSMYLAKRAITRRVGEPSADAETAEFEAELLEKVNALGLGPQAVGGRATALAVHIETYPTHITALPVAVNLQCHSARLKEAVL